MNAPLLRKLRDTIAENRRYHDQDVWKGEVWIQGECMTTYCAAGWVVELTGASWPKNYNESNASAHVGYAPMITAPDGERLTIGTYARRALGLDEDQADTLFYGLDDEDVVGYLDRLIEAAEREERRGAATA